MPAAYTRATDDMTGFGCHRRQKGDDVRTCQIRAEPGSSRCSVFKDRSRRGKGFLPQTDAVSGATSHGISQKELWQVHEPERTQGVNVAGRLGPDQAQTSVPALADLQHHAVQTVR